MNVIYTSDNEPPTYLPLETLIANFKETGTKIWEDDMRDELRSRGWYENTHDNGRYLVINPAKLGVEPTPELHDQYKRMTMSRPLGEIVGPTENIGSTTRQRAPLLPPLFDPSLATKCRHRDDGRGRCIDCGEFI